jgi:hypothetical protein
MSTKNFDASKYLSDLHGKDYLEVKWRLLWLRTEHPDAIIETELAKFGGGLALFRARVTVPGEGVATGWGSETASDFEDYIEKAETKALGRALAALGYGTQFCEDFDFSANRKPGAEPRQAAARPAAKLTRERVVDAPVRRSDLKVIRDGEAPAATPSQIKAIYSIGRDHGALEPAVDERCRALFGAAPAQLSKRQASRFIEVLRQPRAAAAAGRVASVASPAM